MPKRFKRETRTPAINKELYQSFEMLSLRREMLRVGFLLVGLYTILAIGACSLPVSIALH